MNNLGVFAIDGLGTEQMPLIVKRCPSMREMKKEAWVLGFLVCLRPLNSQYQQGSLFIHSGTSCCVFPPRVGRLFRVYRDA